MKFLHAADLHLDSPLRGLARYDGAPVDEIRGATRRAFKNLIDLAVNEEVSFVLLVGDLFDGDWKDYNTGLFFVSQVARLREAGIPAFIVSGNHDAASQITKVLRPPDNVHTFATSKPETVLLENIGVALHGQGFATRAVTDDLTLQYPAAQSGFFNVGLLHTSLDGRPGHASYAPCSVDGLKTKGYDYWALGHVHNREVVSEDPWIVFPGNIQGRHIREAGEKGCSLVSFDDQKVEAIEHRALDVVRWADCRLDASSHAHFDELLDDGRSKLEQLVDQAEGRLVAARITITGACLFNAQLRASQEQIVNEFRALASTYGQDRLWIERVLINSHAKQTEDAALERDDALGGLLRKIRDLDFDSARHADLIGDFAALRAKLPSELLESEDSFDPTDEEALRGVLPDVKELLIRGLLDHGETR